MTKGLFDLAEMGGKTDKMGSINPMMRQGLAHGQSHTLSSDLGHIAEADEQK